MSTNISMLLRSVVFIVATSILLFFISVKMASAMNGVILFVVLVFGIYGYLMSKLQKRIQEKKAQLGQSAEEAISNIRTVKAFASEPYEIEKFR